jgi:hypothetical protein
MTVRELWSGHCLGDAAPSGICVDGRVGACPRAEYGGPRPWYRAPGGSAEGGTGLAGRPAGPRVVLECVALARATPPIAALY